jgi:hypothetical protein
MGPDLIDHVLPAREPVVDRDGLLSIGQGEGSSEYLLIGQLGVSPNASKEDTARGHASPLGGQQHLRLLFQMAEAGMPGK